MAACLRDVLAGEPLPACPHSDSPSLPAASFAIAAAAAATLAALTLATAHGVALFNRRISHPSVTNAPSAALFALSAAAAASDAVRYALGTARAQPAPQTPHDQPAIVGPHIIDAWLLMASAILRSAAALSLALALNQQRWHRSGHIDFSSIQTSRSAHLPTTITPTDHLQNHLQNQRQNRIHAASYRPNEIEHDDPSAPLLQPHSPTHAIPITPGAWPSNRLPSNSVSSPALFAGSQIQQTFANTIQQQPTITSPTSAPPQLASFAAPAPPSASASGTRSFGTGTTGPRASLVSRRSSRGSLERGQDLLRTDTSDSDLADSSSRNSEQDSPDPESNLNSTNQSSIFVIYRTAFARATDATRKLLRSIFLTWEFAFVLLFILRILGMMLVSDPAAFAEQLAVVPTPVFSDMARLATNILLGIAQIIPLFVLAIAICAGSSCAPPHTNHNNHRHNNHAMPRRRQHHQIGPTAWTKFLYLIGVCLTSLWWIEPSLLSRAMNARIMADHPSQSEYESRVCVVPPWWWVEARPNTTFTHLHKYSSAVRVHGWASWMDLALWAGIVGLWAIFVAMRAEYKRIMEQWIWITVSRVQNTFGFGR